MNRERLASAVFLSAALLWQLYSVWLAFRNAPFLRPMVASLGSRIPALTHNFLAVYRFWPLVPLVFAALSFDVARRERAPLGYFAAVIIASVVAALFLQAWLNEAWFRPLVVILNSAESA